ncbi:MAG: PAS domain S-box protein [Actinobacteria bacterium]|nr:PAS domain S-box protein [Actinomycetota bacterium]
MGDRPATAQRERLARFFDLALELAAIFDLDGRYVEVNPAYERVLGWRSAELIGRPFLDDVHLDERDATGAHFRRLISGAVDDLRRDVRLRHRDGSHRWIRTAARLQTEDGLVYAVGTDITDDKLREHAVRERQSFIETLLDSLHDGIVACDADGALTLFNRASRELHGTGFEPIPVERWAEHYRLYAPDGVSPLPLDAVPLYRALRGEVLRDAEVVVAAPDGPRLLSANGQALVDEDGRQLGAVVALRDVTDRRRAEQQARRLAAIVENTSDLVALADLDGNVTFLNQAARGLLGIDEVAGRRVRDFFTEATWARLRQSVFATVLEDGSWTGEGQLRHLGSGEVIDVDMSVFAIRAAESGEPVAIGTVQRDVRGRKRDEAAIAALNRELESHEARFRSMVGNIPGAVYRCDATLPWRMHYLSDGIEAVAGYPAEDFLAGRRHHVDVIHPDHLDRVGDVILGATRRREPYAVEYPVRHADGTERWVTNRGHAVYDDAGHPTLLEGVVLDVTEHHRTQEALAQSEQRFRSLFEHSPIGISVIDLDGRFLRVNATLTRTLGYSEQELQQRTFLEVTHRGDAEESRLAFAELVSGAGDVVTLEKRYCARDGAVLWARTTKSLLRDAEGDPRFVIGVIEDVSERRRLDQLEAREREYRLAAEYTAQLQGLTRASLVINARISLEEILDEVTRQAGGLIGVHRAETCLVDGAEDATPLVVVHDTRSGGPHGATPASGGDPSDDAALSAPLLARDGATLGHISVRDRLDGSFTETDEALLVQLAQLASAAIEKARLYQLTAAQEAARFREELLAGISHDMQTPLASIAGLTDLLAADPEMPTDQRRQLYATLARQSRNLYGLVQQFLDYSRLEADRKLAVRLRPTDVVESIERTVDLLSHRREIVIGAAAELPMATADPERLDQVLVNLLSNAIKFSGGAVRVVARHRPGQVLIDVVDDGCGIPHEDLEQLFNKFHRGSNVAGTTGTGLGLYISKAVIEAMGGTLTVHSQVASGTRFTVRLPAVEPW